MSDYTEEERQTAIRSLLKKHQLNLTRKNEIAEYNRQYYQDHKEELIERQHQHYGANREKVLEHFRQYYQEHKEERDRYTRGWMKEHPEVGRGARRRRRALEAGADGHFTAEEFELLCEVFGTDVFTVSRSSHWFLTIRSLYLEEEVIV